MDLLSPVLLGAAPTLSGGGLPVGVKLSDVGPPQTVAQVEMLTRDGCVICTRVHARLVELAAELGFELLTTDVDAAAAAGDTGPRAEFGDRLPVILLDGLEHSYWEIDEARLRADLYARGVR